MEPGLRLGPVPVSFSLSLDLVLCLCLFHGAWTKAWLCAYVSFIKPGLGPVPMALAWSLD